MNLSSFIPFPVFISLYRSKSFLVVYSFCQKTSFNISCRRGLLAINTHCICLTKFLFLFHFWKIFLLGIEL